MNTNTITTAPATVPARLELYNLTRSNGNGYLVRTVNAAGGSSFHRFGADRDHAIRFRDAWNAIRGIDIAADVEADAERIRSDTSPAALERAAAYNAKQAGIAAALASGT